MGRSRGRITWGRNFLPNIPVGQEAGEETPVDLVEVAGAIKWFDASKGYGFIVPDSGAPDVLLHVTCLRRDGFQTAYEGARIVVEAVDRPKGHAGLPRRQHGRVDRDPPAAGDAVAHPRQRHADQRARARRR